MKHTTRHIVCALLLAAAGSAANARPITYTLQGTWAGLSADVVGGNASNVVPFGPTHVVITAHGNTPDTAVTGGDFVPLTGAWILVSGSPALSGSLNPPSSAAFAVGTGINDGTAGLGSFPATFLTGPFTAGILFSGAGLSGFTGATSLAATPVDILLAPGASIPPHIPLPAFTLGVGSKGVLFDSFGSDTTFSAAVPEPATWTLIVGGIGLTGAALRRRRNSACVGA